MKHLIIDVETLGIDSKSVILQFVAAIYDGSVESLDGNIKIRNWKLDVTQQQQYGRTIDPETMKWWKQQSIEAQKMALIPSADDVDPEVALTEFEEWLNENGFDGRKDFIWQRGSMDHDWIASLFTDCGWIPDKLPIKFFRVRDIRTAVDVLGYSSKLNGYVDNADDLKAAIPGYKQHDAESDVRFEIETLRAIGLL